MSVTILGLAGAMGLIVGVLFLMFFVQRRPALRSRDDGSVATSSIIFGSDGSSSCAPGDGGGSSCDGGGGGGD